MVLMFLVPSQVFHRIPRLDTTEKVLDTSITRQFIKTRHLYNEYSLDEYPIALRGDFAGVEARKNHPEPGSDLLQEQMSPQALPHECPCSDGVRVIRGVLLGTLNASHRETGKSERPHLRTFSAHFTGLLKRTYHVSR